MAKEMTYRVEIANGGQFWYHNDQLHNEQGPAVVLVSGTKYWYLNGELHREDGPAVEYANGTKDWWINGKKLTEEEYRTQTQPAKELTVAEIEKLLGHRVKVIK